MDESERNALAIAHLLSRDAKKVFAVVDKFGCLPLHVAALNNGSLQVATKTCSFFPLTPPSIYCSLISMD